MSVEAQVVLSRAPSDEHGQFQIGVQRHRVEDAPDREPAVSQLEQRCVLADGQMIEAEGSGGLVSEYHCGKARGSRVDEVSGVNGASDQAEEVGPGRQHGQRGGVVGVAARDAADGLVGVGDLAGGGDGSDPGDHGGSLWRQLDGLLPLGDEGLRLEPVGAECGQPVEECLLAGCGNAGDEDHGGDTHGDAEGRQGRADLAHTKPCDADPDQVGGAEADDLSGRHVVPFSAHAPNRRFRSIRTHGVLRSACRCSGVRRESPHGVGAGPRCHGRG